MEHEHDSKIHVHFSEDTDEIGHTEINFKRRSSDNIEAHIGFLQIYHRYLIVIKIPFTDMKYLPKLKDMTVPNLNVKVTKILKNEDDDHIEIHLNFYAYKEKLLREKILLLDPDDKDVVLTVFSRVLGRGKGTPMLRENVTCIGVEHVEDESEVSDWQGF